VPGLDGGAVREPSQVHQARLALDDEVVARPAGLRARLAEARDRAVDEARVEATGPVVAEAEASERAGTEVLEEDVGGGEEPPQDLLPRLRLEVEGEALLAPVDAHEVRRLTPGERRPGSRVVAVTRLLDLDDLRPHVGQEEGAVRAGEDAGEVDDADPIERLHPDLRIRRLAALLATEERRSPTRAPPRRQKSPARSTRLKAEK